jgi:ADP-ribose pyrophosphatase YjhB (NUDIX family)
MRSILEISRELSAIAQAGAAFTKDPFDAERFARLREVASELAQITSGISDFQWPAELGYPTPKVDVRGVVFREGEVLLIKEASSGLWTLPGGWADVNLSPAENVEKECREESGYEVKARAVTAVLDRERAGYPRNAHSIYKIFFLCELIGGSARTSIESLEVAFFPVDSLPALDPHRAMAGDIHHAWEFAKTTSPTAFN